MSEDIVTVAAFQSLPEAEACKLRLESEGLTVFLADAETVIADWLLSNAIGAVKVQVPSAQVATATAVLEQIRQQHEDHPEKSEEDVCLSCGAKMSASTSVCGACGWSYAKGVDDEFDDEDGDEEDE